MASPHLTLPVRVAVPAQALPGDTLELMTQLGLSICPLPTNAKPGKEVALDVPVPDNHEMLKVVEGLTQSRGRLVVAWVKLLRGGEEVAPKSSSPRATPLPKARMQSFGSLSSMMMPLTPGTAPGSSPAASGMAKLTVPVPADAKPGDMLAVQTEIGLLQMQVPAKAARSFTTSVPVPPDCKLSQLTVAWVQSGAAASAASEMAAAATPPTASPAAPRHRRQDSIDRFLVADDDDDGEPADDNTPTYPYPQP